MCVKSACLYRAFVCSGPYLRLDLSVYCFVWPKTLCYVNKNTIHRAYHNTRYASIVPMPRFNASSQAPMIIARKHAYIKCYIVLLNSCLVKLALDREMPSLLTEGCKIYTYVRQLRSSKVVGGVRPVCLYTLFIFLSSLERLGQLQSNKASWRGFKVFF